VLIFLWPTNLNAVHALAAQHLVAAVGLRLIDPEEDADPVTCKNESGSVKGDVAAKEQSVSPIQSEEALGRVAREQITAQLETTLTYRTITRQFQVEYLRDYSDALCAVNVSL